MPVPPEPSPDALVAAPALRSGGSAREHLAPERPSRRAGAAVAQHVSELLAFLVQRLRASPVTLSLIATCLALDWLSRRWGPGPWRPLALWHMGESHRRAILDGEIYRVLASTFLHADSAHLLSNLRALAVAGLLLEPALGARRTLVLYTASGVAGALCHLSTGQDYRILGASGAIAGLKFALVGYWLRSSRPLPLALGTPGYLAIQAGVLMAGGLLPLAALARSRSAFWCLLLMGVGLEVAPPRNLGHLGGAVIGLLLSYTLLIRPRSASVETPRRSQLTALAALACTATLGSIGLAIGAGKAWRLREEPALATIRLQATPFTVDIPELSLREAVPTSGRQVRLFPYGGPYRTPVLLTIGISAERLAMTAEQYIEAAQAVAGRSELGDNERRRVVTRTRIGALPALRTDSEQQAGVETRLELSVDGFAVWVSGYRDEWTTQSKPWVWDGIERRVAESLRVGE